MGGIMGVYLLGTSSSLLLYGLSLHQLYRYYRLYPNDTLYIRIVVLVVMLLETFHSVIMTSSCYHYLVSHFGNILAFIKTFWAVALAPVTSSIITGVAQIFFARRVYLLGFIPRLLVFTASVFLLVHIGLALTLTIQIYKLGVVDALVGQPAQWKYFLTYFTATIADMLLSGCIIHAVRRSRANHQRTEPWIDVFLLYVVNTGLLNGIFNAAPAIMVGVNPGDGFKSSAFNSVVCKLYANTLLAVLNSRRLLLSRGMEVLDGKDLGRSILARAGHIAAAERWNVPQAPDNSSRPILVNITAETEDDCHRVLGTHPGKLEPNRRVSTAR